VILSASVGIGFSREYRAAMAAAALQARIRMQANVLRDGRVIEVPQRDIVPGDVIDLSAGSLVPADAVLLDAADFFVNEALLSGESFPVEKRTGVVPPTASLSQRSNCVFMGSNVRSGTARCMVVNTGACTEFGRIAHRLVLRPPQTEFDRGLLRFGYLVTTAMLIMVLLVFAVNVLLGRPTVETLLFSIALAVGMSPELLPAILSVNLARSATSMAEHGVLVRRLNAIENLGSMTVLCTDKTGTLTEGVVRVAGAYDAREQASQDVLALASINAALQTGLSNPLDDAILASHKPELEQIEKIGEIPYDFSRKRMSVIVREREVTQVITKGAFEQVLAVCTQDIHGATLDAEARANLIGRFSAWSGEGLRVLAVATRELTDGTEPHRDLEQGLTFVGFLTFLDHPKQGAAETIADLRRLGVTVKLISGDAKLVSQHVARCVGLRAERVVTGKELLAMHDDALWSMAESTDLFVEVDPNQKERIILALRKRGHVVGFLGDGINDAPAMHSADTSISVDQAADVAKAAADFVLLERHLDVVRRGIEEGRVTFVNTQKYVLTTMSANLGNMLSMAAASAFLPFLPLLAGQILLNNFLSDIPAVGLAGDTVDRELIERPRRWNMRFIARFMVEFGLLSSLFDFLTFAALIVYFAAPPAMFRTAWFVESLLTELLIALVVRTPRPIFRSRPGRFLWLSTLFVVALTFAVPYLPFASVLGFVALPPAVVAAIVGITGSYVIVTELAKSRLSGMLTASH
jgi:Mg2+-importing ATPase